MSRREMKKFIREGVIASAYSAEEYKRFIVQNKINVYEDEECVVRAFVLFFEKEQLDDQDPVRMIIDLQAGESSYIVVKQICVERSEMKKQYGASLYIHLMHSFDKCDIYTAVITGPKYTKSRSVEFHEKMGFVSCLKYVPAGGTDTKERTIFYYKNPDNIKDAPSPVITERYKAAVDLYIHEDNLVWQKINFFLLLSSALFALDGWLPKALADPLTSILISLFGLMVTSLFYITITNGLGYMLARKAAVFEIEKKLIPVDGLRVVLPGYMDRKSRVNLHKSSTMTAVRIFFILIGIIWLIIMGTAIYDFIKP